MSLKRALVLFVMFFAGELHWLFWGYQLEFLGLPVFAGVWAAGLLFFAASLHCMSVFDTTSSAPLLHSNKSYP
jgi:hypothetical protein